MGHISIQLFYPLVTIADYLEIIERMKAILKHAGKKVCFSALQFEWVRCSWEEKGDLVFILLVQMLYIEYRGIDV